MKRTVLVVSGCFTIATVLFAQQKYRREHMPCPIDGARMEWTGNQQGGINDASCEFSHVAFENGKQVTHKAWASCTEIR